MSGKRYKFVRLEEHVYRMLEELMEPGETFSKVVERLARAYAECRGAAPRSLAEHCERLLRDRLQRQVSEEELDRAAWYIVKIGFGIQVLKVLVELGASKFEIDQQYTRVVKALDQLRQRYGINTRLMAEVLTQFVVEPSKDNKILVNETFKDLVKTVIRSLLEGRWKG